MNPSDFSFLTMIRVDIRSRLAYQVHVDTHSAQKVYGTHKPFICQPARQLEPFHSSVARTSQPTLLSLRTRLRQASWLALAIHFMAANIHNTVDIHNTHRQGIV
jgi:hypothetical protein